MSYGAMVVIENVLATDVPTLTQASAIPTGLTLFRALGSHFRIVLSTLEPEPEIAVRFLTFAGVRENEYDRLLAPEEGETPVRTFRRHVDLTRRTTDLAYVVTADAGAARRCINIGVTPLLCPNPAYASPSFLPTAGSGAKTWDEMVTTLTERRFLRSEDRRADDTDDE